MRTVDEITGSIIAAAMKVHKSLGPGLLESAYEACLMYELDKQGLVIRNQVPLPVQYDEITLDTGYRIDLMVENTVIVELKSVDKLLPVHKAQLLSYLRLANRSVGLLINFNEVMLKNGIRRIVNKYQQ